MAKSHYSIKKRKKELTRKLKQEQKRQRKLDKNKKDTEGEPKQSKDEAENQQVQGAVSVFNLIDKENIALYFIGIEQYVEAIRPKKEVGL